MKMNIEKATAWKVCPESLSGTIRIQDEKGRWSVQCLYGPFEKCPEISRDEAFERADLIVESVKQHAALVAVMEAARLFIQWIPIEAAEKFGADLEHGDLKQALTTLESIHKEGK